MICYKMETQEGFVCERCGITLTTKGNYVAHLKIKTPCNPKSKITREDLLQKLTRVPKREQKECQQCKKLISKANFKRHTINCKANVVESNHNVNKNDDDKNFCDDTKITERLTETCSNILNQTNIDVTKIDEKYNIINANGDTINIKQLFKDTLQEVFQEYFSNNLKQQWTANTSINNSHINNLQIININPYGNEDMSHLTHEFLSHCLMNPTKGITSLIDTIHYSDEMPTNRNIRYKSTKQNTFEKYIDSQWTECDASNTLDELIKKGYRVLNAHYTEFYLNDPEYQDDNIKRQAIEKFRFLSDKTSNEYYSVKRELRLLIKNKTLYVMMPPKEETIIL